MPKIICHEHCPSGSHRGAAVLLVVLAIAAACLYTAARKAAPAIDSAAHTALHVLKIAALSAAGLGALAGAGWIAHRTLQAREESASELAPVHEYRPAAVVSARAPLAIEAPRPYAAETSGVTDLAAPAYTIEEER